MRIIGIDPGTAATGYGIIDCDGKTLKKIDFGSIKTKNNKDTSQRLVEIEKELNKILREFKPEFAAIEDIFFFKNAKSIISVAQARGVLIYCLAKNKVKVFSYTPLEIKLELVGYGRAEKKEVQKQVRKILRMRSLPKPNHAADALAAAICHIWKSRKKQ